MPNECSVCVAAVEAVEPHADAPSKPSLYEVDVTAASVGLKSDLTAAEHGFVLDAGHALGGAQSAPSPVQAFIGSIVACTQITLQLVAKGTGVELPAISWRGYGVFDPQRLVAGTDTDPRFKHITVTGRVAGGGVSQAQLDELAALTSARCPISQSLHPSISYSLRLQLDGAAPTAVAGVQA